jgi:hypothetical protein
MNSTVVISILASILGTAAITLLIPWLVKQTKARIKAQQDFATAMQELTRVVTVLADVPKMIAGHAAAAGAMATEVGKLREAVTQFSKLITKPEPEASRTENASFVAYAQEESADKAFQVAELWAEAAAQGKTPTIEELSRKVDEENQRQASMPSVSME